MRDHLKLGVLLPQFTSDPEVFFDGIRRAEDAGFDSVWLFDHLWPLGGPKSRPFLECWTALAYAAASTRRVTVGSFVTRSTLRHPAVLAKMAATVGAVAPGRLIAGIGSGDEASRPENEAFGLPYHAGDDRTDQLASSVEILHRFFAEPLVSHSDRFATLERLPASPRVPDVRIWVGGRSAAALAIAGRWCDGWNGWGGTPAELSSDAAEVRRLAGGRKPEISWGGQVILGRDDADALDKLGARNPRNYVVGGPETVAKALSEFVDAGAEHLVCAFPHAADPSSYDLLATEVAPRLGLP